MRHLFVGGPGRSGTSFVADRLGTHPGVVALKDIELKIFCEKNGLVDLGHALVETYSPNRAVQALAQFRHMAEALIEGRYGQPALTTAAPAEDWHAAFAAFADTLLADAHPVPQTADSFAAAARALLARIGAIAAAAADDADDDDEALVFLEKTPHNLLALPFLARLAPDARFLHVMRDPRAIAWSLLAMPWGPDALPGAARWVEGYCHSWTAIEADADRRGLALLRVHIEAVAACPEPAATQLTAWLDLAPCPGLFRGVNPAVLARGVAEAGPGQRALLDRRLGGWASRFGYDPEHIGHRPSRPETAGEAAAEAVAPGAGQRISERTDSSLP